MDIIAGLAAASSAIDIAKAMRSAEKNFDAAVYRGQAADLMIALSDAKIALLDAREKLAAQETELERVRAAKGEIAALKAGSGGYQYQVDTDGDMKGYPACPTCLENEARVVFMVQNGSLTDASCPRCNAKFLGVTSYQRAPNGLVETAVEALSRKRSETMERAMQAQPRTQWY